MWGGSKKPGPDAGLYTVTLVWDVVVLAESEHDACKAVEYVTDCATDESPSVSVVPCTEVPAGWDDDCMPWRDHDWWFTPDGVHFEDGSDEATLGQILRGEMKPFDYAVKL